MRERGKTNAWTADAYFSVHGSATATTVYNYDGFYEWRKITEFIL